MAEDVAAASAPQTPTTNPVPPSGPEPATGKQIVIIPCSAAVEGCNRPARSAKEAAEAIGWSATIVDPAGAGGPSAAIQRAVSSGADGIILNSIDAAAVKGDLEATRDAGVAVVCDMCGDTGGLIQSVIPSLEENERAGYLLGQQAFLLAKERYDSPPKFLITSTNEFATVTSRVAGGKAFIDDCVAAGAGCELLAEAQVLSTENSTTGPGRVVSLVQSNPDYNVLLAGYDASLNFFAQGLQQAGLADPAKAFGLSVDADVANTEMIRTDGYQAASAGVDMRRVGYGMVDNLNRLFNDEPVVDQGVTVKIITKDNVPPEGSWDGDFDVTPKYLKLWGKE
ncbi:MAG: substrate-binding domain-containing protein [Actinomycetales bacterium]|nr:substrate-binding domain-containing protein [Actinomycetales bacterium]